MKVWLPWKCDYHESVTTKKCEQENPPECQQFAIHDEACRVVEVEYLWHEGGFFLSLYEVVVDYFSPIPFNSCKNPCSCKNPEITTEHFSDHKTEPTCCRVIVKVMTLLYDQHFGFVHDKVVGDNPSEF